MSYLPGILIYFCACQEYEDCVLLKYDFVTAWGNFQGSNCQYFCIIDKKTSYRVYQSFFNDFVYFSSGDRSSTKLGLCQMALKPNS